MDRRVVTESRLLEILNEELHQWVGCQHAKIVGNVWPSEKELSGCNWELDPHVTYEEGPDWVCDLPARLVVGEAYGRYNIKGWDPS